ncbi:MAG: FAD-dependent oxidoreductase [Acetobacteraceae bacterium]|nr:FAD-dependent oxidoreductase [Acetobacteraceae bacterium]
MDVDIVVIGAGVAGLAASARLRSLGRRFVVIEAGNRIGGRAWTSRPPGLGGLPFDQGAVWLHAAERNPLVPVLARAGVPLVDAEAVRSGRTRVGNAWATAEQSRDYDRAWSRYMDVAGEMLAGPSADARLADVADELPGDPWALTIEAWEGPIIAAAPAARLSLRDWSDNQLSGGNLMARDGLGALLARVLGQDIDVRLGTEATAIAWDGGGPSGVAVETTGGTIRAKACIVTVSTGVLQTGAIRFIPDLPAATRDSIDALPMGLATKVALRASGEDRLDLPAFCTVDRQIRDRAEPAVLVNAWPFGRDHVVAWIGADAALDLAGHGPEEAAALVRDHLRNLFGARADRVFAGAEPVVTRWAEDRLFRGAYAYALPGHAGARRRLAEPVGEGRLLFAGEATHPTLAGTVGGAYLTGLAAADRAAAASR